MTNTIMQTKEVDFQGDILIATQTAKGVFTVVSNVCNYVGLSEKQRDRQVANMQTDLVLNTGCEKLPLKFGGQVRDVLCILIDFLPLWLAKISITPTMKKNNPKLVEKLIAYQLKAKDVLAAAFLPTTTTPPAPASSNCIMINNTLQMLKETQQRLSECSIEHGYILHEHEERITKTEETVSQHNESIAELANSVDNNYLPAYKWDEVQEAIQNFAEDISDLKSTSRIALPQADDRRFKGDKDTLSDDEWDAQCASDLPSRQFAEWANDMVHKVVKKIKVGAVCGNVWREAYKGLQLPNGKQVSCLSELIDECCVSHRYIFALRLTKALHR